jgi:hypothetical protein
MSNQRNRKRRYPGFVKNERKHGRRVVSHRRYELEVLKKLSMLWAEQESVSPWDYAKRYPLFYQYRLAKYFHRNKLLT